MTRRQSASNSSKCTHPLVAVCAGFAVTCAIVLIGCTSPESGRVADAWRLAGPFRALSTTVYLDGDGAEPSPSSPAHPFPDSRGSPPDTPSTDEDRDWASPPTDDSVSTNGAFSLHPNERADSDLYQPGEEVVLPDDAPEHHLFAPVGEADDRFWYLDLGFRMGVTQLHETKQRLDRRLDTPRKLDVFGVFESPTTPIDRKSDLALTTAYIGIGRRETEWLTWNFYFGTGVGGDRDHQRWLLANQQVDFDYAIWYTGLTVDIYPWGLSQRGRFRDLREHFRASRPYLVTGFELGYVRARGWGHFAIAPVKLYSDSQRVEDWLFSYLVGVGWEVPLNERWAYNLQTHYTFHLYRPDEYNGWNVTYALRYQF